MDGTTQAWRDAASKLLIALAKENKYIVSDMVILFLESAGYGLSDYSVLGGVFKRAAKEGIIKKIDQPKKSKQSLWVSKIYPSKTEYINSSPMTFDIPTGTNLKKGDTVGFRGFGQADGQYEVIEINGDKFTVGAKK